MKKTTFYSLLFCATLIVVPTLAHFPDDYEIAKAEAESVQTMYRESEDYEAHIISDSIILTDPNTGAEVYSGSGLSEAILKNNE